MTLGGPGSEEAPGAKPSGVSCTDGFRAEPLSRACWFSEDGALLCGAAWFFPTHLAPPARTQHCLCPPALRDDQLRTPGGAASAPADPPFPCTCPGDRLRPPCSAEGRAPRWLRVPHRPRRGGAPVQWEAQPCAPSQAATKAEAVKSALGRARRSETLRLPARLSALRLQPRNTDFWAQFCAPSPHPCYYLDRAKRTRLRPEWPPAVSGAPGPWGSRREQTTSPLPSGAGLTGTSCVAVRTRGWCRRTGGALPQVASRSV